MTAGNDNRSGCAAVPTWFLAAVLLVMAVGTAVAQNGNAPGAAAAQPAPSQAAPAAAGSLPPQPPPPAAQRGLLNGLGDWWKQSFGDFSAKMKAVGDQAQDINKTQNAAAKGALNGAAQVTTDAATAISRLPNTRVLELNTRCAVAANGAPDCGATATASCRQKGYTLGQPIDIRTQECSAAALGQTVPEADCPEETFLLRAVCQ